MEINLHNFKLLHDHLMSILETNNYEQEHLPEKVMQYIGMIVESEKNPKISEDFFDFFCEKNGKKILKITLQVDPLLAIKVLSMLFINLKGQQWISFLLCQPFVIDAIECNQIPEDEEWAQYYISLLKSLSIRLNNEHLSLFYNKKFPKFPLVYESLKYYNHSDCMVRTNVMNIILGVMKIKDHRLIEYFGTFPFTSYILTYCCQVMDHIHKFNVHLLQWYYKKQHTQQQIQILPAHHKSMVKMYFIDLLDYICYLNDLMQLGSQKLSFFIRNIIFSYLILPCLSKIKKQNPPALIKNAIYLLHTIIKTINDDEFKQTLCVLIMGRQLPKWLLDKVQNIDQQIYIPKVYSTKFSPKEYYWNKFDYQIQKCCLKIFSDITNFETEHDREQENKEKAQEFQTQIKNISNFIGFQILNYEPIQGKLPLSEIQVYLGLSNQKQSKYIKEKGDDLQNNHIRQALMSIFQQSVTELQDDLILSVGTLINYLSKSQSITNNTLQYCGLLLPKLDTVNYVEDFNIKNLQLVKNTILSGLSQLIKQYKEEQQNFQCSIASLKTMFTLLDNVLYESLTEQSQQIIHDFYTKALKQVKILFSAKNMKDIVQNFQYDYSKWGKEAFMPDSSLPISIFHINTVDLAAEIDLNFLKEFNVSKDKIQYFIRYLAFVQNFYFKYIQKFANKDKKVNKVLKQKYNLRYNQKYGKVQETWQLGKNYQIMYCHMVQCKSIQQKGIIRKLIIVQNKHNLIIVQPSKQQNTAKIILNHPWKYVTAEIDRSNGRNMIVKISKCVRGALSFNLIFEDQVRSAGTLQWMNQLKYQRYQSEQALILGYIRQCLSYQ